MNTKKQYIRPHIACMAMDTYTPIATSLPFSDEDAYEDASSNRFDFKMWDEEEE